MKQVSDCIFCKIASGAATAVRVYEDDLSMAFMDISPASRGHTLVISKNHFPDLASAPQESLQAVAMTVQKIARAQLASLRPDGVRVGQFNGSAAGQTVFHYHVHVVPVWEGQGRQFHGRDAGERSELDSAAGELRAALADPESARGQTD